MKQDAQNRQMIQDAQNRQMIQDAQNRPQTGNGRLQGAEGRVEAVLDSQARHVEEAVRHRQRI